MLKLNLRVDFNEDGSVNIWSAKTRKWERFAANTKEAKDHWACVNPLPFELFRGLDKK